MDNLQGQSESDQRGKSNVFQSSIFDWQECVSLPVGMEHAQAVWFDDQLCVGGGLAQGNARNSARLYMYNPSTDRDETAWQTKDTPTSSFALACYHSKLILIGGYEYPTYKPTNKLFSLEGEHFLQTVLPMHTKRIAPSAVAKGENLIVAGGMDMSSRLSSVEIYNDGSWFSTYSLPKACQRMKSTTKGDNWYLSGGFGQGKEIYSVSLQALISGSRQADNLSPWRLLTDVPFKHSSTSFINDQLLMVGGFGLGFGGSHRPSCMSAIRVHSNHSWMNLGDLPVALCDTCSVVLPSGETMVIGGTMDNKSSSNRVFKAVVRVDLQSESVAKPTMYKEKVALYKEKVAQQLSGNELSLSPSSSTTLQLRQISKSDVSESEGITTKLDAIAGSPKGSSNNLTPHSQLTVSNFSLPGIDVLKQTSVVITNAPQSFSWKGYGFKLDIPKNSLPCGIDQCVIHVITSIAGQYQFPDDCEPVSAVFWVRCDPAGHFRKTLTAELNHCAEKGSSERLAFVRALCSQKSLPYTFKFLKSGHNSFTDYSSYGSIQLDHFSGLAIVGMGKIQRIYTASLYYVGRDVHTRNIHFVVSWDDEAHLTAIREYYKERGAKEGCDVEVEFEGNEISLDIPMPDGITVESWKVTPLSRPAVSKKRVDYYSPGRRIPSCQLKAKYTTDRTNPIPELLHAVCLIGTKGHNNMITIDIDPSSECMSESRAHGFEAPEASAESSPTYDQLIQHVGIEERLLNVPCSNEHLKYIASHLPDWLKYAQSLGLSVGEIQGLKVDPSLDYPMKAFEMLVMWHRAGGFQATYKRLVEQCLRLKNAKLAEEICQLLIQK